MIKYHVSIKCLHILIRLHVNEWYTFCQTDPFDHLLGNLEKEKQKSLWKEKWSFSRFKNTWFQTFSLLLRGQLLFYSKDLRDLIDIMLDI